MEKTQMLEQLGQYLSALQVIKTKAVNGHFGSVLHPQAQELFEQIVIELRDLFDEFFGPGNLYSQQAVRVFNIDPGGTLTGGSDPSTVQRVINLVNASLPAVERAPVTAERALAEPDGLSLVLAVCRRFHVFVRQLARRHAGRPPLEIQDEYDLQDLLHALLRLHFDDVRPEEHTPSHGGASSRLDFLLKDVGIVVETKKTRSTLRGKEVGEELMVDRERYRGHPDVKRLVCLVYDPEELIENPHGLVRDLEKRSSEGLPIHVVISPSSMTR